MRGVLIGLFIACVLATSAHAQPTNADRLAATEVGCIPCTILSGEGQQVYNYIWSHNYLRQPGNAMVVFGAQAGFDLFLRDGQAWWASVALFGAVEALAVYDHIDGCGGYCCNEPFGGPWQCLTDYASRAFGSWAGRKILGGPR